MHLVDVNSIEDPYELARLASAASPANRNLRKSDAGRRWNAQRLWHEAHDDLRGTPVDFYLRGRGLDLRELCHLPTGLRYLERCWHSRAKSYYPVMLASVVNGAGDLIAVHRTYLTGSSRTYSLAPLSTSRIPLGRYSGGFIPIWPGATGRPIQEAGEIEVVCVTKGIEDAIASALLAPQLRVISAISIRNMADLSLPPIVRRLLLIGDNHQGTKDTAQHIETARKRQRHLGRNCEICRPDRGAKDVNEWLLMDRGVAS